MRQSDTIFDILKGKKEVRIWKNEGCQSSKIKRKKIVMINSDKIEKEHEEMKEDNSSILKNGKKNFLKAKDSPNPKKVSFRGAKARRLTHN